MLADGFIIGSLNLLTPILNIAPGFLQFSKKQSSITPLNSTQISSFKPYTFFASTAYCYPSTTYNWSCGAHCAANWDFKPIISGGDGGSVQFWYVRYSPSQATVIVAHQGTDVSRIEAVATDAEIFLESSLSSLASIPRLKLIAVLQTNKPSKSMSEFPHDPIETAFSRTARKVLSAVQTAIVKYGATQVTIVGHSLGAAIALLDVMYLPLHISDVSFRMIGYGMPRVGNKEFADYIDANLNVTHINNKKDYVPTLPGLDWHMDYHHPSGEIHIMENNEWVSRPGQDNTSKMCSVGAVPEILDGNVTNHSGPFDNVIMGVGC